MTNAKNKEGLKQFRNIDLKISQQAANLLKTRVYHPRSGIRALEDNFETLLTEPAILNALTQKPQAYYEKSPIKIHVDTTPNYELKFIVDETGENK